YGDDRERMCGIVNDLEIGFAANERGCAPAKLRADPNLGIGVQLDLAAVVERNGFAFAPPRGKHALVVALEPDRSDTCHGNDNRCRTRQRDPEPRRRSADNGTRRLQDAEAPGALPSALRMPERHTMAGRFRKPLFEYVAIGRAEIAALRTFQPFDGALLDRGDGRMTGEIFRCHGVFPLPWAPKTTSSRTDIAWRK